MRWLSYRPVPDVHRVRTVKVENPDITPYLTPTTRLEDCVIIYNMRGKNTAALVALLNLFNLKLTYADALYDAIKAGKKFDPVTVNALRKSTIENSRADQVNAITNGNPNFVPLKPGPVLKLTDQEMKQMQAEDNMLPTETPDPNLKPHEIKADQVDVRSGQVISGENGSAGAQATEPPVKRSNSGGLPASGLPASGLPPSATSSGPATSGSFKVTNDDPDYVEFPGEPKKPAVKVRATPVPTFRK
jgi:hypothetical protein